MRAVAAAALPGPLEVGTERVCPPALRDRPLGVEKESPWLGTGRVPLARRGVGVQEPGWTRASPPPMGNKPMSIEASFSRLSLP